MPEINENTLKNLLGDDPIATSISVRIRQDEQTLSNLERRFNSIKREAEGIAKALKEAGIAAQNLGAMGGLGGKTVSTVGSTKVEGGIFTPTAPDKGRGTITRIGGPVPPGGAPPIGGPGGGFGGATASAISQLGNIALTTMDQRIERGYQYSLSADRMNMLFQQMKGMSQQAVQSTYRQPLTQYKLGTGGINALLGLEAGTGMAARQQAASVEALRVSSGFSINAQAAASALEQLASPQVANRMFMMTGMSIVKPGGGYRSLNEVMQGLVKSQGLTDPRLLQSALQPGSVTRANLTNIGVTGDLQTQLIQYAQQNQAFKQRGGSGMYDPSNKAHQKIMGIDKNFAMQAEETDRVRGAREEQFYSRQADNFADMEKQTQALTRAFGALEDKLSGVIGKRASTQVGSNILGTVLSIGGAILGGATGNPALAIAGYAAGQTLGAMIPTGDGFVTADQAERRAAASSTARAVSPTAKANVRSASSPSSAQSSSIWGSSAKTSAGAGVMRNPPSSAPGPGQRRNIDSATFAWGAWRSPDLVREVEMAFTPALGPGGKSMTLAELAKTPDFINQHPAWKKNFIQMALAYNKETGQALGLQSGYRSPAEQHALFISRYRTTSRNTGIFYQGSYWEKISPELADVAPPDAPWANHVHGLAGDLIGNYDWLEKNASRFGFESFAKVNNEPWHLQLAGIRESGTGGGIGYNERTGFVPPNIGFDGDTPNDVLTKALRESGLNTVARGVASSPNARFADLWNPQNPLSGISTAIKGTEMAMPKKATADAMERWLMGASKGKQPIQGVAGITSSRTGQMSNEELMGVLYETGFRGDALVQMFAIARRESGGVPSKTNFKNELSYGLFQHNMDPAKHDAAGNRRDWGLTSNEELLDPATNARVAFMKYNWYSTHGDKNGFEPWGPYRGMHQLGGGAADYIPTAISTAQNLKYISNYTGPMGPTGDAPPPDIKPRYRPELQRLPSLPDVGGSAGGLGNVGQSYGKPSGNTITIAPTINISSTNGNLDQDLERVARKVAALLEREVNRTMMRRT